MLKSTGVGAAGYGGQDRRIHFQKTVVVLEYSLYFLDYLGSLYKCFLDFRIYDEVYVSLTVSQVGVFEAVPFVRQNLQRLGKQSDFNRLDGDFAVLGLENRSRHAYDVADVISLEPFIFFVAYDVASDIALDSSLLVLYIYKGSFAPCF